MVGANIADDHIVAALIAVPSVISAAVGVLAFRANRHAKQASVQTRPNGAGTLVEMAEQILESQRAVQVTLGSQHVQQLAHEQHDDRRFDEVDRRLERIETQVVQCPGWLGDRPPA